MGSDPMSMRRSAVGSSRLRGQGYPNDARRRCGQMLHVRTANWCFGSLKYALNPPVGRLTFTQ